MGAKTAHGFTCFHCGHPLPIPGGGVTKCAQCGTDNFIELPGQAAPAPAPAPPPAPVRFAPAAPQPVSPPASGGAAVAAVGGVVLVGGVIALLAARGLGTSKSEDIVSWVGSENHRCLVDADGDGTADVVGYGVSGGNTSLMALHGRSGKVLWSRTASDSPPPSVFCDTGGLVSYREKDLTFRGLDPASGKDLWAVKLRDKLESVGFGKGCVVAKAADGSSTGLASKSGTVGACAAVGAPVPRYGGKEGSATVGDLEIRATPTSGAGTPRVQVQATRQGARVWETTIATIAGSDEPRITASPSGVVVAGPQHGAQAVQLVLLDPKNGSTLATRELPTEHNDATFLELSSNGPVVFLGSFGMLHAYDSKTLAPLWFAGSMWAK